MTAAHPAEVDTGAAPGTDPDVTAPGGDGGSGATAASGRRRSFPWALLLALAVSLLAHGLMATGSSGPVWMDDEVGYLGNAAFLAGVDQPLFYSLGYWGGWSLTLIPLYLLLDDPGTIYAAAVSLSALLGALVVLPAYALGRAVGASVPVAVAAAVIVTNVPDRTVMSNYALSENALVLATFVAAALVFAGARSAGRRQAVLYVSGTVGSLMAFAVHARAAALVGGAVLLGAGLLLHRGRRLLGLVVLVVSVGGALGVYRLNSALVDAVYRNGAGGREGNLLGTLRSLDPTVLALPASGQAWYQVAAFAGLSLVGGAVVLAAAWRQLLTRGVRFAADGWLLSASVAGVLLSLAATSAPIGRGSTRVDFFFYGRYITHLAAVLALIGLVWLLHRATVRALAVTVVGLVVVSVVFLTRGGTYGDPQRPLVTINVPAVTPWPWPSLAAVESVPLTWVTLTGFAVLLLVFALRRHLVVLTVLVVGLSLVAGQSAAWFTLSRFDTPVREGALPFRHTLELVDADSVVLVGAQPFYRNGYQFWLWPTDVLSPANTDPVRLGERDVAVGSPNDERLAELDAEIVVCDRSAPQCLWVPPGDLQDELRREGALAVEPGELLPPAARSAGLTVLGPRRNPLGQVDGLRVRVRHDGGGAPWPALGTQEDALGVVRLSATWEGGQAIADLPRSLLPGEEADLTVVLPDLPDDLDEVRLTMVVEGRPDLRLRGGQLDVPLP